MTPKFKIGNPANMEDTEIDMPALDNLDDMVQQDFTTMEEKTDEPDTEWDLEPNILTVLPRIINDHGCQTLINMHENAVFDDVTIENLHDITPSERVQKFNLSRGNSGRGW